MTEGLKQENVNLQRQIAILEGANRSVSEDMTQARKEKALLTGQIDALKAENDMMRQPSRPVVENKPAAITPKKETEKARPGVKSRIRIKVLTGDGNLKSAQRMAKRLEAMEYRVKSIDFAPRSDFQSNMVFFAREYKKDAARLVSRLGGNAVLKPLTWSSVFHVIVVTGKGR